MNKGYATQRRKTFQSLRQLREKRTENAPIGRSRMGESHKIIICKKCNRSNYQSFWEENRYVCPDCGYHMPIPAKERITYLMDEGSFREMDAQMITRDPLRFPGYRMKVRAARRESGMNDALLCGTGRIHGVKVALAVLDSSFLMGSMGPVVGEKLVRLTEYATSKKLPLIVYTASGGARMQEGLYSLMQMARTSAAVERFMADHNLYLAVLTHPTTGGVSASFATLADIILAEPEALIGFAGPRVIEQTIGQKLPAGFQKAEFQMEHGLVDEIVTRSSQREVLARILKLHGYQSR